MMDAATGKLIGVSVMFLVSLATFFVNSWATYVIGTNPKLSQTVRLFFVTEHILRVVISLIMILFATTCAYTFFCVETDSFSIGWLVNRVIGSTLGSTFFTFNLFAFAISANRFFAVFLDGRYYGLVTKGPIMQLIFLLSVPLLCFSPCMLEGQVYYYDPDTFSWWSEGDLTEFITGEIVSTTNLCLWTLVICFDSITAFTIRRKMKKSGKTAVSKTDVNIMKQVVFSHLLTLLYFILMRVFEHQGIWEQMGDLDVVLLNDFLAAVIDVLAALARLYLLGPPRKKKVAVASIATARKLSTSSVTKTGTSGTTEIVQN